MKRVLMCLLTALLVFVSSASASNDEDAQQGEDRNAAATSPTEVRKRTLADACEAFRSSSDNHIWGFALFSKIAKYCNAQEEGSESESEITGAPQLTPKSVLSGNIRVNDPSGDTGNDTEQNETSIAVDTDMGKICVVFNDLFDGKSLGYGTSSSGDPFSDEGAIYDTSGDPTVVYNSESHEFIVASLRPIASPPITNGLGTWSSTDCQYFSPRGYPEDSIWADKELLAVDNNPSSPYFGRMYIVWTDYESRRLGNVYLRYSDDAGATWWPTNAVALTSFTDDDQHATGAWPAVAPNGDVYVAWLRYQDYDYLWNGNYYYNKNTPIDIDVVRSTNGGNTWTQRAKPISDEASPTVWNQANLCGRPALEYRIRLLASPQIAVGPDGVLHIVYSKDPDGFNFGDVIDVYYSRSTDQGGSWQNEIRLNDDPATPVTDQWYPTLSVGPNNTVLTAWYDRRLNPGDPDNRFDYFARMSIDGGLTWPRSFRLTTESSGLQSGLGNSCYHGDYDQQTQWNGFAYLSWADDRRWYTGGSVDRYDPDVYFEKIPVADVGFLTGRVYAEDTGYGIVGAKVEAVDVSDPSNVHRAVTELDGWYNLPIIAGTYVVTASADGYFPQTVPDTAITVGGTTTRDFCLADRRITVTFPNGGEVVPPYTSVLFRWDTEGTFSGPQTVELALDPQGPFRKPAPDAEGYGLYAWSNRWPSTDYAVLRVKDPISPTCVFDDSDGPFIIHDSPKSIPPIVADTFGDPPMISNQLDNRITDMGYQSWVATPNLEISDDWDVHGEGSAGLPLAVNPSLGSYTFEALIKPQSAGAVRFGFTATAGDSFAASGQAWIEVTKRYIYFHVIGLPTCIGILDPSGDFQKAKILYRSSDDTLHAWYGDQPVCYDLDATSLNLGALSIEIESDLAGTARIDNVGITLN